MRSDTVIVRVKDYPQRAMHHVCEPLDMMVGETNVKAAPRRLEKDIIPSLLTPLAMRNYLAAKAAGVLPLPTNEPHVFQRHAGDTSYAGGRVFRSSMALDSWAMQSTKRKPKEEVCKRERVVKDAFGVAKFGLPVKRLKSEGILTVGGIVIVSNPVKVAPAPPAVLSKNAARKARRRARMSQIAA